MKDSPLFSPLHLTSAPFVHLPSSSTPHSLFFLHAVSSLYIHAQTVNVNKAFSHTELMYPVHFANVLPFKCHLLCCCCEYILARRFYPPSSLTRVLGFNCLQLPLQGSYTDSHLMTQRFVGLYLLKGHLGYAP